MTREQFEKIIEKMGETYPWRHEVNFVLQADAEQRQVIEELTKKVNELEHILNRKGYRKSCDIPACNCGDQWNHGGLAEARLNEIDDALPYVNGKTILQRVEHQAHTIQRLREALENFTQHAIVLSPEYLKAFDSWPSDKAIQGWEKHRWIKLLEVKRQAQRVLEETK